MHWFAFFVAALMTAPPPKSAAAPPKTVAVDTTAAFNRLKQLDGMWKTDVKGGSVQFVTWRLVAGGSAMLETASGVEKTNITSVTMYAFEGTALLATHYGPSGTEQFKLNRVDVGGLRFGAVAKNPRVEALTVSLASNTLTEEWTIRDSGRSLNRVLQFQREYIEALK